STLPASEFPAVEERPGNLQLTLPQALLKSMLDNTSFAMEQQDVRYYLNGLLLEVSTDYIRVVATDGHRLALHREKMATPAAGKTQVIVPRKGILELSRRVDENGEDVELTLGQNHLRVRSPGFTFSSKLVDGKFPDYDRVLPKGGDKVMTAVRNDLRQALMRTAILSNEKFRGIRLMLANDELKIVANNPEQEEAEEIINVEYKGASLEIGFNVSYLVDVLSVLSTDSVQMILADSNSSVLIQATENSPSLYVVMPMRL